MTGQNQNKQTQQQANSLVRAYVEQDTTMSAVNESGESCHDALFDVASRASDSLFDVEYSPRVVCEVIAFQRTFVDATARGLHSVEWETGAVFTQDDTLGVVFDADRLRAVSPIDTSSFTARPFESIQRPYDWIQFRAATARGRVSYSLLERVEQFVGVDILAESACEESIRLLENSHDSPVLIDSAARETDIVLAPVTLG